MPFFLQVLIGMTIMAIVDAPAIKYIIRPTLESTAKGISRDKPNIPAALVFYVGYVSLVIYLSQIGTESTSEVAIQSALLGLFAYGTYEFTNMAVLKGWSWRMVATDTIWGTILTAAIGTITYVIAS